jgi:Subtilase family
MAIISGQALPAAEVPVDYKRRVVVKFRPGVRLSYSAAAAQELAAAGAGEWSALSAAHPGITLVPYFSTMDEGALRDLARRPSQTAAPLPPSFTSYYAIECPAGVEPAAVARTVAAWSNVETAYVEAGPTPPPLDPSANPRNADQHYEDPAPDGIDVRYAWSQVDGSGIGFVDMEQGWTLNHEDLVAAGITIISGQNKLYSGHGTAVLGEVLASDNMIGDLGIAPNANARVVSQWRDDSTFNTAEAILSAASVMSAGDVLLLEAQTTYPTVKGYLPVEVEPVTFDAIQYATSQGIIVVEAGANGSIDLDTFKDFYGKFPLKRGSADFKDSGAIMVGAASSAAPHSRLSFSNYGSRIDCYAWGENIDTTGDGGFSTATNVYTGTFGGTSGASPMVAGSALIIQSWKVANAQPRLTPSQMRTLLSDSKLNTASANPATDRIGVMPNLGAIMAGRRPWFPRFYYYLAWAWMILIGALLITPGGVFCIKCGPANPGYIGDVFVNILGVVAIAIGAIGLVGAIRGQAVGGTR